MALDLASRAPMAKDSADCGLADCGLEHASWRVCDLGHPRGPLSWADSEVARTAAQNAPVGSFGNQV
eukprot:12087442-Alexandrium_andersonii.AAC.1